MIVEGLFEAVNFKLALKGYKKLSEQWGVGRGGRPSQHMRRPCGQLNRGVRVGVWRVEGGDVAGPGDVKRVSEEEKFRADFLQ